MKTVDIQLISTTLKKKTLFIFPSANDNIKKKNI